MPDPLLEVLDGVYQVLEADASLDALAPGGVWTGNAPDDVTAYPYIAVSVADATDLHTFTRAFMHPHLLFIRAVDRGDDLNKDVDALARVYELLNDQTVPITGFNLERLRRLRRVHTTPVDAGVTYQNLVDQYAVEVAA